MNCNQFTYWQPRINSGLHIHRNENSSAAMCWVIAGCSIRKHNRDWSHLQNMDLAENWPLKCISIDVTRLCWVTWSWTGFSGYNNEVFNMVVHDKKKPPLIGSGWSGVSALQFHLLFLQTLLQPRGTLFCRESEADSSRMMSWHLKLGQSSG